MIEQETDFYGIVASRSFDIVPPVNRVGGRNQFGAGEEFFQNKSWGAQLNKVVFYSEKTLDHSPKKQEKLQIFRHFGKRTS